MSLAFPKPTPSPREAPKPPQRRTRIARGPSPRRSKRPNKVKAGEKAEMRREATRLCSAIAAKVAFGLCQYREPGFPYRRCATPGTEGAHVLNKKAQPSVRFLPANLLHLCHLHHELVKDAPVGRDSRMRTLFVQIHGLDEFEGLCILARESRKFTAETLDGLRGIARGMGLEAR